MTGKKRAYIRKKWDQLAVFLLRSPFLSALGFILITWISIAFVEFHIESTAEGHNINNLEDSVWWGIVTLLTVGYGDKFPVTTQGRIAAGLLMISGVVAIAIVTAKISSFFLERALREGRGFVNTETLKNHFVICGWKEEMGNFLIHLLNTNKTLKASSLVLLNSAPESEIDALLQVPRLKGIKIIRGDYYTEVNLRRAAPEKAAKILLLADAAPNAQGQIPTLTEADARTIMTAMTLNNITKGVPIAAEILDSNMDHYLRLAHVNEIIYSRDYSRMLLAMSSTGVGVTNIFHDLMDPHSPAFLGTKEIPEIYLNKTYAELQQKYHKDHPKETLIGILENSGNSHVAKEKAIRRAQQTPNVAELVKNLQGVKELRFNRPQFALPADYIIKEGSMAIVIEDRGEGKSDGDAHGS